MKEGLYLLKAGLVVGLVLGGVGAVRVFVVVLDAVLHALIESAQTGAEKVYLMGGGIL